MILYQAIFLRNAVNGRLRSWYWPRSGLGVSVFSNRAGSGSLLKIRGPAIRW